MYERYLPLLVLAGLVLLGASWWWQRRRQAAFPYRQVEALFTPAEQAFLAVLDEAVGADYRVFGKVRIADVVQTLPLRDRRRYLIAQNRINAKHFDFAICRRDDLAVHAVVELNDRSHLQRHRQQRDRFVRSVCEAAQLRLVEIPAAARYSASAVREAVFGGRRPRQRASEPSQALAPECPECQAPMVRRRARSGRHQGREFWACSNYPDCRALLDIDD
ncbi:DUF2726 domain-containing protein [Pseudomonas oryzihabitans]|uniref:Topoisomerase n=1 Tax=Pseudomonas oryzihabitans TaxID=47885 RepID=A0AAJ2BIH9_9PSED|nr:DUF2726 domain-containing protein [Pseudomonas psychrotolerans]MDR6233050.1 hypothetical protein [Pseudomonas psychrotolerans]MDR6357976.1 hypothetical protein [Pseudomonas psychrotolerans]MDR6677410.1 hypothetical protein [Pseudomonas psychrotolerans]